MRQVFPIAWLALLALRAEAAAPDVSRELPKPLLRVVLGEDKPPYILAEARGGIEYRLVTRILDAAGYRYSVSFAPNRRAQLMLANGSADVAIGGSGGYLSRPYIAYKNMAITLCSRNLRIDRISDLAQYGVAAFQNARLYLGPEYAQAVRTNPEYHEVWPQIGVNRLLYSGRVAVAISDINVFNYFSRRLGPRFRPDQPLCTFPLFAPTQYRLAFAQSEPRDRFDAALEHALAGHLYEDVAREYGIPLDQGRPYFRPVADR